jgi:putative ABC transport system substrate-binding protein
VQQQTRLIPIVFVAVGDPVQNGIVKSVARPEGNATGITNLFASVGGKWVELLKEVAPQTSRIATVWHPTFQLGAYSGAIETTAKAMAIELAQISARTPAELAPAIAAFAAQPNGGLLVSAAAGLLAEPAFNLAVLHKLPSVGPFREIADAGSLVSYGSNITELFTGAATYVDRILRGANVTDLPVQFPTRFELIVNLKTAKAIGLEVQSSMLTRADKVIE